MPVYISKSAISKNPFFNNEFDPEEQAFPPLSSTLLRDVDYLKLLILNNKTALDLKLDANQNKDKTSIAVIRLKMALNVIDGYVLDQYNIQPEIFNIALTDAWQYDQKMFNAVTAFQTYAQIPVTGIVNAETLHKIDNLIDPGVIINDVENEIIGKIADPDILINDRFNDDGSYELGILINGQPYTHVSSKPIQVSPIINNQTPSERLNIKLYPVIIDGIVYRHEQAGSPLTVEAENTLRLAQHSEVIITNKTKLGADFSIPYSQSNRDSELNSTPPKIFNDEHAIQYKIQSNDDIINIVRQNYYNTGSLDITNPFQEDSTADDYVIFTFPERKERPVSERDNDPRFQFYLNLLYYANTVVDNNGDLKEYGIEKAGTYQRYNDPDLNAHNIHDNVFEPSNQHSVYPNYYRFLKAQEASNPNSKLLFDSNGNCLSFQLSEGKNIYIPSRQFADALYYQLNFRHSEMLTQDLQYVDETVLDSILDQMAEVGEWITNVANWLINVGTEAVPVFVNEVVELYRETLAFYKAIYNYAINVLTQELWRGWGGHLGLEAGVTWGIPLATDVKAYQSMWRKFTPLNELTFVLRSEYEAFVGFDTGESINLGANLGSGKKRNKIGLALGAGFQAGLRPNLIMEYEFPVRQEETALLTMLFMGFGKVIDVAVPVPYASKVATKMIETLSNINLDPGQYLTWMKFGFPVEVSAWGKAQAGLKSTGAVDEDRQE